MRAEKKGSSLPILARFDYNATGKTEQETKALPQLTMSTGATTAHKSHDGLAEQKVQRTKQEFRVPRFTQTLSE